jgi:hypothetical protein
VGPGAGLDASVKRKIPSPCGDSNTISCRVGIFSFKNPRAVELIFIVHDFQLECRCSLESLAV